MTPGRKFSTTTVGEVDELEDTLAILRIAQVDLDAALVAVERQERVGLAVRAGGEDAPTVASIRRRVSRA
jgi:hypothetical protein